ncbi:MAG: hypothetical protein ABI175_00925, partial [Polyangiales bacterium]
MAFRSFMLRLGSRLGVLLLLGAGASACQSSGNGIGTAPDQVACFEAPPEAATSCPEPLDGGAAAAHVGKETIVCAYAGTCAVIAEQQKNKLPYDP